VRLHPNDQIAEGHVRVMQPGEVLLCKLVELIYEPGAGDDNTDMHVNPADVAAARAMWFEDKGRVQ
jgi:hypothetical protein